MKKPSSKRLGLLRLLFESPHEWVYFPVFSSLDLAKYNLTLWDTAIITWSEKAGLIETKEEGRWGRITEAGKELLDKFSDNPPHPPESQRKEGE